MIIPIRYATRSAIDKSPIDVRDINLKWIERDNSDLPSELVYADDCDFVTEDQKKKETALQHVQDILPQFNLLINNTKTEHTVIKRLRKMEEEKWRTVKKLGSLIGDREDIQRRKDLAVRAIHSHYDIWKRKKHTRVSTRLKLYGALVKSILLYNCGTWGVSKTDEKKLDSFHRRQLRIVLGIRWPHKIKNTSLYKATKEIPLSVTITERRWKLLGHVMRLPAYFPSRKAMK